MKDDKASNFIASRRLATRLDVNLISQKFFWDISVVIIVNTVCSNIHAMSCRCCYRHQIPPQSINWTPFLRFSTSDCAPYFFISFFTSRFLSPLLPLCYSCVSCYCLNIRQWRQRWWRQRCTCYAKTKRSNKLGTCRETLHAFPLYFLMQSLNNAFDIQFKLFCCYRSRCASNDNNNNKNNRRSSGNQPKKDEEWSEYRRREKKTEEKSGWCNKFKNELNRGTRCEREMFNSMRFFYSAWWLYYFSSPGTVGMGERVGREGFQTAWAYRWHV